MLWYGPVYLLFQLSIATYLEVYLDAHLWISNGKDIIRCVQLYS
jgi:hypothetical protein